MKRLLPAFSIAVLIHLLVFESNYEGLLHKPITAPQTDVLSMRLVTHAPPSPAIHPAPSPPPLLPPPPEPVARPKPVAKPIPKPKTKPVKHRAKTVAVKKRPPEKPPPVMQPAVSAEPVETVNPPQTEPIPAANVIEPSSLAAPKPSVNATLIEAVPRYNLNPPPVYPKMARKRGYAGVVLLDVFVKEDGRVADLTIIRSSGYTQLDASAVKSVKKWQFEPGRKGDRPVAMWVRVPVDFRLN